MRLIASETSPYARLIRVLLAEKGLSDTVAYEWLIPQEQPAALLAQNPLAQVPTLAFDDGPALTESTLIAQHVDALSDPRLIPVVGPDAPRVAAQRGLAQGVIDHAVRMVQESRRPSGEQSDSWLRKWRAGIDRALDVMEPLAEAPGAQADFGVLSFGVALGYLDFRRPEIPWRDGHPKLAALYEAVSQRASFQDTAPPAS